MKDCTTLCKTFFEYDTYDLVTLIAYGNDKLAIVTITTLDIVISYTVVYKYQCTGLLYVNIMYVGVNACRRKFS